MPWGQRSKFDYQRRHRSRYRYNPLFRYQIARQQQNCSQETCRSLKYKHAIQHLHQHPNAQVRPTARSLGIPQQNLQYHLTRHHPQLKRGCRIATDDEILKLCKDPSLSYRAIVKKLGGGDMKRVRRICKEHGYARHRSKKRLEAQRLCRETTLTYKEIREKIGVHKGNVSKWCKGIKRPGKILSPLQKKRALQKKKAIDLCIKTDMSAEDIAKEVGVVAGTIYGWCKGLVTIRQKYLDPEMIPDLKRRARKLCRSKSWTLKEIAEYLGVEKSSNISSWCKGIIRPSGESRRKSRLKREVRSLYQKYLAAGKPFIFIKMAKHFGVGRITLSRWTKDLVPTARDPETIETEVLRAFEERGRILPAAEAANTTWRTAREILIKHGKNIKKNKCSNCGDRRHYRNSCPYRRHNPRRRTPDIGLDFLYRII